MFHKIYIRETIVNNRKSVDSSYQDFENNFTENNTIQKTN